MPSTVSRWLRHQIKLIMPMLARAEVESSRAAQDALGALASRALATMVEYLPAPGIDESKACWATPRDCRPSGHILYLHGGGYVAGSLDYAKLFGGVLAAKCKKSVLCLGYPLAPENPYPAALQDAHRAYEYMLDNGCRADALAVVGESAGGGLTLALVHSLLAAGLPLPAALVCISPWADLTLSGASLEYNRPCDVSLSHRQLEHFVQCYAPADLLAPTVSPAWGSFLGFPPALLFAGGDEIILDDARAVLRGYRRDGGQCRLVIEKGMWHAYPLYPTAESARALDMIDAFLNSHFSLEDKPL